MGKIIREILRLLWKLLRLIFWKWLRPRLGRILLAFGALVGVIVIIAIVLAGSC